MGAEQERGNKAQEWDDGDWGNNTVSVPWTLQVLGSMVCRVPQIKTPPQGAGATPRADCLVGDMVTSHEVSLAN